MVGSVLNIKVLREIRDNFKSYLSVILIATLAVTLFTGILANYQNFESRLNAIYEKSNMCDAVIMTKDSSTLEQIEKEVSPDVMYQKRIYQPLKWQNNNIYLVSFTTDDKLNLPYSTSKEELLADDVLVDENFLKNNNLKIGDEIVIPVSIINIKLTITGTMTHPESLENSVYNPAFIYVGIDNLKKYASDSIIAYFYNQILLKGDTADFLDEVKNKYDDKIIYALNRSELPTNMTVDADVTQAKQLIYIFPVIFYLVAILIILTSISQLINRESKNIGILKALGFKSYEILLHYLKIFILLGLIGSILGIILGPLIVPNVMGHKYDILYQLPKIDLPFFRFEYLISVVILVVITALTSLIACHQSLKMVPAASLRGENSFNLKLSFFSRFKFFKKIPLSILMAFRNMRRKISRTFMVIVGVLGCSALLVCGFGIEDTLNYGLDLEFDTYIPYDISVTYLNAESLNYEKVEGIKAIDEYAKYPITIEKEALVSSYMYLLPEKSQVFTPKYDNDSVLLSSRIAEEIGCKVGDTISFNWGNQKYSRKVTDIVDFCISQGIFLAKDSMDVAFNPTGAWLQVEKGYSPKDVVTKVQEISGVMLAYTMQETKEHTANTISSIKVMTWTVKIFAILLAVVVLYNLALLNFKERTKDIATLKVLGFSRLEVASSFMIEIIFLTFIGSLIGLFFGYPLLVAVLSINKTTLIAYIYHINLSSYLLTVLITCGSSLLINLLFAFLTNRVQMVESLKSVE